MASDDKIAYWETFIKSHFSDAEATMAKSFSFALNSISTYFCFEQDDIYRDGLFPPEINTWHPYWTNTL